MRKREGFTLIELMIVVAIIAIIIAIALPGLIRAKMAGNERSIAGSLKSITNGQETASNTVYGGSYWALDVVGLYFVDKAETATDADGDFYKFITDVGLAQADLDPGASFVWAAGFTWEYNDTPASVDITATTRKGKAGYVVRSHSTMQVALVQGTAASYGVVACPMRFDRSGANCYIVDEEATVYKRLWNGATSINAVMADAALLEGGFMATWPTSAQKGTSWSSGGQ